MTTQDGATVHFYDDLLKGKIVVIDLFYTQCQDSCPLETARLAQVQRMLGDRVGKDIFFYSISIDPKRDTPFLLEIGRSFGRPVPGLTREAKEALVRHSWPGNVRELRNALERAAIVSEGSLIAAEHLSLRLDDRPPSSSTTDLNVVERETIEQVLRECRGNKSEAAKRLGLSRHQLYVHLRKYQIGSGTR